MRMIKMFIGVLGLVLIFVLPMWAGQKHEVPTAPKEYLEMKNPFNKATPDVFERGKALYEKKCKKCHGESGDGKGTGAKDMDPPPTAFNDKGYMSKRQDGQLFWITEKGSPNTDMEGMGPGSDTNLSNEDIWKVITYIRATFVK